MVQGLCFLNDQWISLEEATVSISDLAVVRGFGVFDYLRTYGGQPFHLWDHLQRFQRSAKEVGLSLPYSLEEIGAIIDDLLRKTAFPETALKLLLTGGVSEDQFSLTSPPTFCIMAYPHLPAHKEPIEVITTRMLRPLPHVKSTCYLPALVALEKAHHKGASDVLYVNAQGEVLEGSTSNIFVVKKRRLITPVGKDILAGITREVVIRCAAPHIEVSTEPLPLAHQHEWDEVFLTSSSREIRSVLAIDGTPIGSGKVGPLTIEMQRRFTDYVEAFCTQDQKLKFNLL